MVQQVQDALRVGVEQAQPERRERKHERNRPDGRPRKANNSGRCRCCRRRRWGRLDAGRPRVVAGRRRRKQVA